MASAARGPDGGGDAEAPSGCNRSLGFSVSSWLGGADGSRVGAEVEVPNWNPGAKVAIAAGLSPPAEELAAAGVDAAA